MIWRVLARKIKLISLHFIKLYKGAYLCTNCYQVVFLVIVCFILINIDQYYYNILLGLLLTLIVLIKNSTIIFTQIENLLFANSKNIKILMK